MLNRLLKSPILSCSIIFVICSVARLFEYFYMMKLFIGEFSTQDFWNTFIVGNSFN